MNEGTQGSLSGIGEARGLHFEPNQIESRWWRDEIKSARFMAGATFGGELVSTKMGDVQVAGTSWSRAR